MDRVLCSQQSDTRLAAAGADGARAGGHAQQRGAGGAAVHANALGRAARRHADGQEHDRPRRPRSRAPRLPSADPSLFRLRTRARALMKPRTRRRVRRIEQSMSCVQHRNS
eukprot:6183898-Pleurochrysis_carterae.AAC.1